MLIVTVDATVPAADQTDVIAFLNEKAETIRKLPGNLSFRTMSGEAAGKVTVLQEWTDAAAFDGYRNHPVYGELNAGLGPKLIEPPAIRQFDAIEKA